MNITLTGKKISQDERILAFKKDNLTAQMTFTVDTDDSWTYKLDVLLPVKCCTGEELFNIIDLPMDANRTCMIDVTASMVPLTGKYTMQLRGISGEQVYHSDTFEVWVKYSIDPGVAYDPVPSEFYQIEDNITEINNHPPKPGENGYWLIWDAVTHQYKESAISLPDGTLPEVTADTSGKYLSNDGKKAYWAEVQAGTEGKIDKIEVNNVEQPIIDKTVNIAVPTKTSDLSNDSGYITNEALDGYATKAELPTKVSQLENDSKFINESALDGYAKTADIPINTSQLNNDSGYITANDIPVKSVDGATGDVVTNAVKTTVQTLTDAQKQQARDNIGVVDVPTPSAENVGKIPVSKQVGDGYKYVMEDKSTSDLSLGLTGAQIGQIAKITAVDASGKPTQWEATALPNEAFIVYFTLERKLVGDPIITSDRTLEEVIAAITTKKLVIALLDENNNITQLCNIANASSYLYFFTISKDGHVEGIGWKIDIDMSGETTSILTTMDPLNFIGYNGVSGSNQIFGTGELGGYEFKQHIGFENLPEVTTSDNGKFMRVVSGAWAAAEGDASFDITGASTGQSPIINAVDADGKPTAWGAALLAKVDGSNIPSDSIDAFRTRIAALPGVKVYGKADNGKIKAYTDAACTQEATVATILGLVDYGNALLIYDHKTYQCVGFEETASTQGAYLVVVLFRSEIATDSSGAAVLKVETAKLNLLDYLNGVINAPITITAGELPLTTITTT